MARLKIELEDTDADDVFEILQELVNRAKEAQDDVVLVFIIPRLMRYGEALINAKRKAKITKRRFTLPKIRNITQ